MKFKKGDRVRLTQLAVDNGAGVKRPGSNRWGTQRTNATLGTIVSNNSASVLWDGLKTPESYSEDYLELINDSVGGPTPCEAGSPLAGTDETSGNE